MEFPFSHLVSSSGDDEEKIWIRNFLIFQTVVVVGDVFASHEWLSPLAAIVLLLLSYSIWQMIDCISMAITEWLDDII